MQYKNLVFAEPLWLWGLLVLPIVFLVFKLYKQHSLRKRQLTNFADPELLPHLLITAPTNQPRPQLLSLWCWLWLLGIIAMANPRWKFIEYETYRPDSALAIVLDLSQTMQAEDLKSTRVVRAKQQIQDILNIGRGIRVGLVGFAKVAHLVTPITDDFATILHLLPAIDADLIHKQGQNLNAALLMAGKLLQAEPGQSKHILILSDGNFQDNFADTLQTLTKKHITVHVGAVGTTEGAPFKDASGAWHKHDGKIVVAKLNADTLKDIAKFGGGKYWQINYAEADTASFVKQVLNNGTNSHTKEATTVRQWDEGFFVLLFPMLFLALLLQRKQLQLGVYIVAIGLLCIPSPSFALDLLHNNEQQGEIYFKNSDYEKAATKFVDPYRKGVALYKAGQFAAAEQAFKDSNRAVVKLKAQYNLGNAQLKQGKYKQAIKTYEAVLDLQPDHQPAQDNLKIAQELLKNEPPPSEQKDKKPPCSCKNKNKNKDENGSEQEKSNAEDKSTADKDEANDKKKEQEQGQDKEHKPQGSKQKPEDKPSAAALSETESDKTTSADKQKPDPETEAWLKQVDNNIKMFLKNKFLIEER